MILHWFRYTEFSLVFVQIILGLIWRYDLLRLTLVIRALLPASLSDTTITVLPTLAYHLLHATIFVGGCHIWAQGPVSAAYALSRKTKKLPLKERPFFGTSAVVTGCNTGIGLTTAESLAALGFRVIMVCRNRDKTAAARASILRRDPQADLRIVIGDIADLDGMKQLADKITSTAKAGGCFFSLIVQNAGMFSPTKVIKDGFDVCVLTNHLGPYLLVELLRPHMERRVSNYLPESARNSEELLAQQEQERAGSSESTASTANNNNNSAADAQNAVADRWSSPRIVLVGSVAHVWATPPRFGAPLEASYDSKTPVEKTAFYKALSNNTVGTTNLYGVSKACNSVHARLIQREEDIAVMHKKPSPALAVSVHPGFVASDIWRWMPPGVSFLWKGLCFLTAKQVVGGAQATLSCCIDEPQQQGGGGRLQPGGFHADCRTFPASSCVRDNAEVRAVEAWTKEVLARYL